MPRRASRHRTDVHADARLMRSGGQRARVVHHDTDVTIGLGEDRAIWLFVADAMRRPRGHEGFEVQAAPVIVEPNGLVRVLDRRVPWSAIERLLQNLAIAPGQRRPRGSLDKRIPDGVYGGLQVQKLLAGYEVSASVQGATSAEAERVTAIAVGERDDQRWLVPFASEPALRRLLVDAALPSGARLIGSVSRDWMPTAGLRRRWVLPQVRRTLSGG